MKNQGLEKYLLQDQVKKVTGVAVNERFVTTKSSLHWHNYLELELILSGSGEQLLNGQKNKLNRGCLSVMRLTDFHQVLPTGNLHLLNLMVDDKLLSEDMLTKITACNNLFFNLTETEAHTFEMLYRLCMAENQAQNPDFHYIRHLIHCIFLRVLKMAPKSAGNTFANERPIQAALLYIHMHFRENPKLSQVAKIAHYNSSHFSATFHKELGTTYCDYLNMLKISYAKELLISTNLKILDICNECGFTSHSNFLRLFKENTGLSPLQFRKRAVDKPNPQVV